MACSWTVSGEPKLCSALGCTGIFSGVKRLHKIIVWGLHLCLRHSRIIWAKFGCVGFTLGTSGLMGLSVNPVLSCHGGGLIGPVQFELQFILLSYVWWKFILGLLPILSHDLLLHSSAKQLALKLDSLSESNCYLSLLHLAAEILCSGTLFAQSCAWLPWVCWAFVNTLRTSVLSLDNLAAGAFMLLDVHEKFYWCEIVTGKTFTQSMEMLILISSLFGVFSPFFYALRHPPILHSLIWPSSIFLYQLKLYSLYKAFWFWQCLDIRNIKVDEIMY